MKATVFILIFLLVALVVTKPTDTECTQQVTQHYIGSIAASLVTSTASNYLYRVEDHIFYKTVTNTLTGNQVGVGVCGYVFVSK